MNKKGLENTADVLRRDVLKMTSAAGSGHPTSCMSCAEIMASLFFEEMKYDVNDAENPNNDEFILSKGHAAPILYSSLFHAGCIKNDLMKLRKISSPLEGHPMPRSLKWIKVASGSLGQGLSVGVGMALAAIKQKRDFRTYVLMGDSEVAEGSVYEALQLASHYGLNNLCTIVDANRLGQRGETMIGHDVKTYAKRFESFGWDALIINGHDVNEVLWALKKFRKNGKPTAIIAKTFKGKGVSFLEDKENWHGKALSKEELEKALREVPDFKMPHVKVDRPLSNVWRFGKGKTRDNSYNLGENVATRFAYGKALGSLAEANGNVIVVDAEVSNSTHSDEVKKIRPEQFIEAYISEQNLVGICLGMSKKGFDVFGSTFATFFTRAHDQIRMSALSSANFTLVGSHVGVSIGEDGCSQMGLEDIALFRALPDSTVFYPSDAVSTDRIVKESSKIKGIKFIRTTREKTPVLYKNTESFRVGDFKVVKQNSKSRVVLVGAGITLFEAIKAHEVLKKSKVSSAVVDLYCVKPFNGKKFVEFVKQNGKKVVICEDHRPEGGIGEMLSGVLSGTGFEILHLAVREIPHSGKPEELLKKYKIDSDSIVRAVKKLV